VKLAAHVVENQVVAFSPGGILCLRK